MMDGRRVVVTGVGAVTPLGIGCDATWDAARAGVSGTGPPMLETFAELPFSAVGQVKGFVPTEFLSRKVAVRTDRNTHFAFAACGEALQDAGIDPAREDPARIGIVMASSFGGLAYILENLGRLHQKGPSFVSAYVAIAWIPAALVGQLSIAYGVQGYSKTILNDAAGGIDAIGVGARAIRRGDADLIIAGGFEAPMAEAALATFSTFADFSRDAPDPERAHRPFDMGRTGTVLAEGGAVLVLEELERARARGARIYAELAGFAQTSDAVGLTEFARDGGQYARAVTRALAEAEIAPGDVDYLSADGRATVDADRAEARAVADVFGGEPTRLRASAPKSMMGSAVAGAGPIEVALAVLAMRDGVVPPTINLENRDPECRLPLVTGEASRGVVDVAVIAGRGTAGANSVLALRRPSG
jgi:3-oxoacyl-[acyl-carrier-protein] synthase II